MIIGVTGSFCSGKDTFADYLATKKAFVHYSLSDELREELKRRGIDPTRENLIAVGTALRKEKGNAILAERVLERCRSGSNYIITSLRHPSEIETFKKEGDFHLVNVDAAAKTRFERMLKRNRPGDPQFYEKFVCLERKESRKKGSGQQLQKCAGMADVTIMNDTDDVNDLYAKIEELLSCLAPRMKNDGR